MRHKCTLVGLMAVFALLIGFGSCQTVWADEPVDGESEISDREWTVEVLGVGSFKDIEMVSSEDGWALTDGGALYHFNGTTWQLTEIPGSQIQDIDVAAGNDVWVVGSRLSPSSPLGAGVIWHYDGAEWRLSPSPPVDLTMFGSLDDIHMISPTDGWATGWGLGWHEMLRYDGTAWKVFESDFMGDFDDIDGVASDDVWGIDDYNGLYHYDGDNWRPWWPEIEELNAISMVSADEGWAVGDSSIAHYDGASWITDTTPTGDGLADVQMLSADEGWAVGYNGTILYYDGSSWNVVTSPTDHSLYTISMVNADDGWAAGYRVILHYDGSDWQIMNDLISPGDPTSAWLEDVNILSANKGWAVGQGDTWGSGEILYYDGVNWVTVTNPATDNLYGLDMLSPNEGWAVGWDDILRYDGTEWSTMTYPTTGSLHDVDLLNSTEGWVVASGYELLHYDGGVWDYIIYPPLPSTDEYGNLHAIDMISSNEGWAVGETWSWGGFTTSNSAILRYDGAEWVIVPHPNSDTLYDVDMISSNEGWAVGGWISGEILHYDGTEWLSVIHPTTSRLYDVEMLSPTEGWAIGSNQILYYDGAEWELFQTTSYAPLRSISMVDSNTGRIVGSDGLIMRLTTVAETYTATGAIYNSTGDPLEGILVHTDRDNWSQTDSQGRYTLTGLEAGDYTLTPRQVGYTFYPPTRTVTVPPSVSGQDFTTTVRIGTISGQVTHGGAGIEHIRVLAYLHDDGGWHYAAATTTGADGNYALDLLVGTYRVYFSDMSRQHRNEYYDDVFRFDDATDVTVAADQTTSVNATLTVFPSPEIDVDGQASTAVDPDTGQVTIRSASGVVTITRVITCTGSIEPTDIALIIDSKAFSMTATGNNRYSVGLTIPDDLPSTSGSQAITVSYTCDATPMAVKVGQVVLYDPSGQITDSAGNPVEGAVVNLYRVPGALPDKGGQTNDCRTVETRPGGVDGDWSDLPAANIDDGAWVNTEVDGPQVISPTVNPQVTGSDGRYGWDVAEGCWYVVVEAEGYDIQVSPLVGVPPEVTDLNLAMEVASLDVLIAKTVESLGGGVGGTVDLPLQGVVTYTIILNNPGSSAATGVLMTDTLPTAVDFGGWVQRNGAQPLTPTDVITWSGDIAAETEETIRFTATISTSPGFAGHTIINTANFTSTNAGSGTDDASFTIAPAHRIYLPLVLRN